MYQKIADANHSVLESTRVLNKQTNLLYLLMYLANGYLLNHRFIVSLELAKQSCCTDLQLNVVLLSEHFLKHT